MSDEEEGGGGDDGGGGGGAPMWMATFADLMSLLLAFFVLLFSFSSIDDRRYKQVGGSLSEAFGVQRRQHVFDQVKGINHIAQEYSSGRVDPTVLNIVSQENLDIDAMQTLSADSAKEQKEEENKDKEENTAKEKAEQQQAYEESDRKDKQKIEDAGLLSAQSEQAVSEHAKARPSEKALSAIRKFFRAEEQEGTVNIEVKEGNLVMRITEEGSFPPGSADTVQPFEPLINKMADILAEVEGEVTVAGHTDSIPIRSSRYRSNWELSSSRAVTVVEGLISRTRLNPSKFEVHGHGDTRPLADNSTPEGRALNRRVEVIVALDQLASTLPERLQELVEEPEPPAPPEKDLVELNEQTMEKATEQLPDPIFNLPEEKSKSPDFIFGGDFFTGS